MKQTLFNLLLVLMLIPALVYGQSLTSYTFIEEGENASVIKVVDGDEGMRLFATTDYEFENSDGQPFNLCRLHVLDYNDKNQITNGETFILSSPDLANINYRSFKIGKKELGSREDIRNYTELVEAYPELSDVDYLDEFNKKRPESFYKSTLDLGLFKSKVKGFKSQQFKKGEAAAVEAKENRKKKKGLRGKLGNLVQDVNKINSKAAGMDFQYVPTGEVSHDWEDSYNGGQDKKNFWRNIIWMSSTETGNLVALNGLNLKDDDMHEYRNKEIVVLAPTGELITRSEIKTDEAWNAVQKVNQYKTSANHATEMDFTAVVSKQQYHKKKNPGANKKQLNVMAVSGDGSIKYNHTYDFPLEYSDVDTVITNNNGETVVMGYMERFYNKFVLVSSPSGQKVHYLQLDKKDDTRTAIDFISSDQGHYAMYANTNSRSKLVDKYYIYKLDGEQMSDPMIIETKEAKKTASIYEILVNEGDDVYVLTRENVTGIQDFKWEMAMPHIYKIEGNTLSEVTDITKDKMTMRSHDKTVKTKVYEADDAYYFLASEFRTDEKGKLINGRSLVKLAKN